VTQDLAFTALWHAGKEHSQAPGRKIPAPQEKKQSSGCLSKCPSARTQTSTLSSRFSTTLVVSLLRSSPRQVLRRGYLFPGIERACNIRRMSEPVPDSANTSIDAGSAKPGSDPASAAEVRWETLEEGKAKVLHRPGEAFYNPAQVDYFH
jgi:hypothetical protein